MPTSQSPGKHPLLERSDEELAREARAGSLVAFEALVVRFEPRLMAFLLPRCPTRDDAADVVQQSLLAAWSCLHQYDGDRPFAPWVFTISARIAIKNQHRDHRRKRRERLATQRSVTWNNAGTQDPTDSTGADNIWTHAARLLTDDAYTALWLRYAEGMDPQHIGPAIGKRPGAVRVLLHRARQRLQDALPPTFFEESAALSEKES